MERASGPGGWDGNETVHDHDGGVERSNSDRKWWEIWKWFDVHKEVRHLTVDYVGEKQTLTSQVTAH
jgi:hypothetical protein